MSVNGVRPDSSWAATRVSTDRWEAALSSASSASTRLTTGPDLVSLSLGPRTDRREQLQEKLEAEKRKLKELQQDLEERADRSGFSSFLAGLFGSDEGRESGGSFLQQLLRSARFRHRGDDSD